AHVAQADIDKRGEVAVNGGNRFEKFRGFRDRHVQYFGDIFALVQHFQGLTVIARAITDFTRDINVRQEVHLNLQGAVTLAGLTAPAFNVKAKASRLITAHLRLLSFGKKVTDFIEHTGIGCRVGPWRTPDR